jgi:aspartate/glutamate racemase
MNPIPITRWNSSIEAISAIQKLRRSIYNGSAKQDQEHPSEILFLDTPNPDVPPVLLLGGMGPLAGLDGFEAACNCWGDRRQLLLYQACHIPCRTEAILAECNGNKAKAKQLVQEMGLAIFYASTHFNRTAKIRLLLLCNTAHYFLPRISSWLRQYNPTFSDRLEMVSLVRAGVVAAKEVFPHYITPLNTIGGYISGVGSKALANAGIPYTTFSQEMQQILHQAIYEGIKAMNIKMALQYGNAFFLQLLKQKPSDRVLLAGCTEIPVLYKKLLKRGAQPVQQFLASTRVINPAEIAIKHL